MSVKITGNLDGLNRLVEKISSQNNLETISLGKILNDDFFKEHTDFDSFKDLCAKASLDFKTVEELDASEEINIFIRHNTKFENFLEMQKYAASIFMKNRIIQAFKK